MRLRCDLRDDLSRTVFYRGFVDPIVERWIGNWLRRGDTYVDVGAHIGLFVALALDSIGADGRVVALEPLPENFQRLSTSVAELQDRYPNVELYAAAVGATAGKAQLFGPSAGAVRPTSHASLIESPALESVGIVDVVTLDDLLGPTSCRLLKIDVEGHEVHVLRGAGRLLKSRRAEAVLVEINPQTLAHAGCEPSDLQDLLEGYGYRLYGISDKQTRLVPAVAVTEVEDFTDALFLPR
jgi:FkbM family methyltransferase